jgi:hypothetical protein
MKSTLKRVEELEDRLMPKYTFPVVTLDRGAGWDSMSWAEGERLAKERGVQHIHIEFSTDT